jgi:hypothetical protein
MAGFCKHDNESFSFVKIVEFVYQLSKCQFHITTLLYGVNSLIVSSELQ